MDTKELINRLRENADWAEANEWVTPIDMSDCMREAAEKLEQMQWVDADERLPEKTGEYLVHIQYAKTPTTLMYIGCRHNGESVWKDKCGEDYAITHWMPLPPAPEEGVNDDE